MGQAKQKAARPALSLAQREAALGSEPFAVAYELVFGMISAVFAQAGCLTHELIGIEFEAGKPTGVNVLAIRRTEDVPRLRTEMLDKWPMVVHVCEAWAAPDLSAAPHAHPLRYDIVSVMLHTLDMVASAACRVDVARRTIERSDLLFPDQVGGRLGCELPTRH